MDGPRGNQDGGARGKLDDKAQVEQDEVTAKGGIIGSQCKNGAKAIWHIGCVDVLECHDSGTAVERTGWEDAVFKRLLQMVVLFHESLERVLVLLVQLRGIKGETA